jgi:DHA1 family tetracycline resistance protein-like MFS transporter
MKSRASMMVLFLTVFIDLIGFGIVLPLLGFFANHFAVSGFLVSLLSAVFSLMQFLFTPFWGRLSDKMGRRPIILISLAGSTISYLLLGFCSSFWQIFGTRVLAGFFGGNIAVANAYVADVTPPEKRSQGMGMIGAAFGLGFVLGPAIAEAITHLPHDPAHPEYIYHMIGWVAGGICGINLLVACFTLPESLTNKSAENIRRMGPGLFESWRRAFSRELVAVLILIYFVLTFAFANFEALFSVFISKKFSYDVREGDWFFLFLGLVVASVQGGMIGRLVKAFGEKALILYGGILLAASLAFIPFANGMVALLVTLVGLGIGQGVNRSSIMGLISQNIDSHEQGAILGVAQSSTSLARILGPIAGGLMFDHFGRAIPFVASGILVVLILLIGFKTLFRPSTV